MFDPYNPFSMFNSSSESREYLSETSKNKIRALLPIVQKLYLVWIYVWKKMFSTPFEEIRMAISCHMIWARMKEIFKEEYNIDWKAPAECEPDVYFD